MQIEVTGVPPVDVMKIAAMLYYQKNPMSRMDVPNSVYITTERWYNEWLKTEPALITEVEFFRWCMRTKTKH